MTRGASKGLVLAILELARDKRVALNQGVRWVAAFVGVDIAIVPHLLQ